MSNKILSPSEFMKKRKEESTSVELLTKQNNVQILSPATFVKLREQKRNSNTYEYNTIEEYDTALIDIEKQSSKLIEEKNKLQQQKVGAIRSFGMYNPTAAGGISIDERLTQINDESKKLQTSKDILENNRRLKIKEQTLNGYTALQNAKDFTTVSERGKSAQNPELSDLINYYASPTTDGKPNVGNKLSFYFSNKDADHDWSAWKGKDSDGILKENLNDIPNGIEVVPYGSSHNWDELTDEEVATYNYVLAKNGESAADTYLKDIQDTLDKRAADKQTEATKKQYEESGAVGKTMLNVQSVAANVTGGIPSMIEDAVNLATDGEVHPYSQAHSTQQFGREVRELTSTDIQNRIENKALGAFAANTYQAIMSGADSLAGAVTLGSLYTASMGGAAASQKARELQESGASIAQIALGSIASGAIEYYTEKVSLDKWAEGLSAEGIKGVIKKVLAQGAVEATEETRSYILNLVSDSLIQGYNSASEQEVRTLMNENGLSEDEARKQVAAGNALNAFWSAYGGFVSGSTMMGGTYLSGIGNVTQENNFKKSAYNAIVRGTDTEATLKTLSNSRTATKGVKDIATYASRSAILGSNVTKQSLYDTMSERGYTPSQAIQAELKKNIKTTDLSKSGVSDSVLQNIEQLSSKLDTAFAAAWYDTNGLKATRSATNLYVKGVAAGDAVSAMVTAIQATNENDSDHVNALVKKANKYLPDGYRAEISSYDNQKNARNVIRAAETYLNTLSEQIIDVSQDYTGDIISDINSAYKAIGTKLDSESGHAISELLLYGRVNENFKTVLSNEKATDMLSHILGMYIDGETNVETVRRKAWDMISVYKAGQGAFYSKVAALKHMRMKAIESQLKSADINSDKILTGFQNTIYNGKLTRAQAEAIAKNSKAFDIFVEATYGKLTLQSTVEDMIAAAGLVVGFDLAGESSLYYDSGITEVIESDRLVSDDPGLYDPETGKIILNKNAELSKKLGYRLAREILQDDVSVQSVSTDNKIDPAFRLDGSGKLHFDGEISTLSELQRGSLKALEQIADALGVDFYIETELGSDKNGWFDPKDNSIHISIDAGTDSRGTMLYTAAHELTHFIRKWSPEKWEIFSEFIIRNYVKNKVPVGELIVSQKFKAKRHGREIDNNTAQEELIADACEMMLTDGSAIAKLSKLKKTDSVLFERIKYFISNIAAKIKKLYENLSSYSIEAKYLSEMNNVAVELQQMFNDALYDAGMAYITRDETISGGYSNNYRFQIRHDPNTKIDFVSIPINDIVGEGIAKTDSISRKARIYLNKKFKGVVLPVGKTKNVYIRKEGINETTNPAKRLDNSDYRGKMFAMTELDNLLRSSSYLGWTKDDGRHPDVIRWIKYRTTFLFTDESGMNQVIQGVVKNKRIAKGDCFYDIT